MSNIFLTLTSLFPDQVCLEVSPKQLEQAWPSQQEYSYDVARWTAYKNRLTLDAFLDWLKAESGIEEQPQVLPSRDDLSSIWDVVNGTAIGIGETRIVLIPEAMDTDEYEVQAEWVDIPSWAADYYLAVQVNSEDCWLRIWGYTTHKKLKQAGQYDGSRRTYSLKREELIEDLNVMWVARELGYDCKAAIKPLPSLASAQAQSLLEQLSQETTSYSPRLEVPFAMWGALISNEQWRQQLYDLRLSQVKNPLHNVVADPIPGYSQTQVNLNQWFNNIFEAGWQPVKALLRTQTFNLDFSARSIKSSREIDDNSASGVTGGKLIDLKMQLADQQVALTMRIVPKTEIELDIRLRVCPVNGQIYLPPSLQLIVWDETGASLKAEARSNDNWIQLQFSAEKGEPFSVKVALGDVSVSEELKIL
ncbi:hypothetical protein B7486_40610 [cyanobacterium TDX16]|nr:hypothetical protein B7486_40610 [cyanobacterium TDX16]